MHFEIDAYNFIPAFFPHHARALAQLRKADMRSLTQLQAGGDQNAVDFEAGAPFEFEQDIDQAGVTCTSAQYPAPAGEDRAGERLYRPARLVSRYRPHLQSPWNHTWLKWVAKDRSLSHAGLIGCNSRTFMLFRGGAGQASRGAKPVCSFTHSDICVSTGS